MYKCPQQFKAMLLENQLFTPTYLQDFINLLQVGSGVPFVRAFLRLSLLASALHLRVSHHVASPPVVRPERPLALTEERGRSLQFGRVY